MQSGLQDKDILLVDDNPADLELISYSLLEGIEQKVDLRTAGSLKEATEQVRQAQPDIILLDLGLPDATELSALIELRELAPTVPIIVLTGNNDQVLVEKALKSGAQDYLVKDSISGELLQRSTQFALVRAEFTRERQKLLDEVSSIANTVPGVIYRFQVDHAGKWSVPYVSSKLYDVYGFSRTERTDLMAEMLAAVTDRDRQQVQDSINEAVHNESEWESTYQIQHPRKGLRTLNALSYYNGVGPDGSKSWTGLIVDRTEEERQKEELNKLSWVVSNSSVAMLIANRKGEIQWANSSYEKLTGYTQEELIGNKPGELLSGPDSNPKTKNLMAARLVAGKGFNVEVLNYRSGREPYWASSEVVPAVDEDGQVDYFLGLQRDITKQRESALELERQRALLERASEISGVGAWQLDLAKNKVSWSPQTRRIHEVDDDFDLTLDSAINFYTEEGKQQIRFALQQAIDHGTAYHFETRLFTAKGSELIVELAGDPWEENGKTKLINGVIRDVTEIRQRAEQLEQAKEIAEKASMAKSEFLATMSHEMRTPLNAIVGFGDLLQGNLDDEDSEEYVKLINQSGQILTDLVTEILDFSKIESGEISLFDEAVDISEWLESTIALFEHSAKEKGLEMKWSIDPDLIGSWNFDSRRLKQVLINLLRNAIKFTSNGYISIIIKPGINNGIRITVSDTGIGIPDDKLNIIFEPFEQVDSSRTREYGGTGLGLAICKRIVEALNGQILLESTYKKGSSFHVDLPLSRSKVLGST